MNPSTPNAPDENAGDAALDLLLDAAPEASAQNADSSAATAAPAVAASNAEVAPLDEPPAIARLDAATAGLQMPSETDAPFRTVYWPLEKSEIKPSEIALYLTENADASVETQSLAAFFQNAVAIEDWMDDEEKATAQKFEKLVETLGAELERPRVYRIGEREITAAIVGKVGDGFGGIVTTVVET